MKLAMKLLPLLAVLFISSASAECMDGDMCRHNDPPERRPLPPPSEGVDGRSPEDTPPNHDDLPPPEEPKVSITYGSSNCATDPDGFFGSSSTNGISLEYVYELEYKTNVLPRITNKILQTIENGINDVLLPVLFEKKCSAARVRALEESGLRRHLSILGVSTLPRDDLLRGVSCTSESTNVGNKCVVIVGKASVFVEPGVSGENDGKRSIDAIQDSMDNGWYDNMVEGVDKVMFVEGSYTNGVDPSIAVDFPKVESSSESTDTGEGGGLPGYAIALIVVGCVAALAGAAVFVAVHRKKRAAAREIETRLGAVNLEELASQGRPPTVVRSSRRLDID